MTTAVTQEQPIVAAGNPLRPVEIRAHLLPPEIGHARRARRARRLVLTGLALLLLVVGGGYGLAVFQTSLAEDELASIEDQTVALARQQRAFNDVVVTEAESAAINTELTALLADDLRWSALLSSLRAAAPAGVKLTGISTGLTDETTQPDGAGDELPSTAQDKVIGAVTLTGDARTKAQVAAYVDALSDITTVADPFLDSATRQNGIYHFNVRIDLTAAALGGRYTADTDQQTGDN